MPLPATEQYSTMEPRYMMVVQSLNAVLKPSYSMERGGNNLAMHQPEHKSWLHACLLRACDQLVIPHHCIIRFV